MLYLILPQLQVSYAAAVTVAMFVIRDRFATNSPKDPNTKRFKRTLIYFDPDTHFRTLAVVLFQILFHLTKFTCILFCWAECCCLLSGIDLQRNSPGYNRNG